MYRDAHAYVEQSKQITWAYQPIIDVIEVGYAQVGVWFQGVTNFAIWGIKNYGTSSTMDVGHAIRYWMKN